MGIYRRTTPCSPLRTPLFKVPLASPRSSSYVSRNLIQVITREKLSSHIGPAFREGPARSLQLGRPALKRRWWYPGSCCRKTPCTWAEGCNRRLTWTNHFTLQVDEEQRPMSYTQSFQLLPDGAGSYYVFNDIFRLVYAAA
jgi:hypothetical protein